MDRRKQMIMKANEAVQKAILHAGYTFSDLRSAILECEVVETAYEQSKFINEANSAIRDAMEVGYTLADVEDIFSQLGCLKPEDVLPVYII